MRSTSRSRIARAVFLASLLVGVAIVVGCGGDSGPPRYHLSGTATFDGKPIASGSISFTPDKARGNKGPGSFASIGDGRYETAAGKGTVGGPHVLTITAYPKQADTTGGEGGPPPLFSGYDLRVDLPKEDSTYDIDVPPAPKR